MNSISDEASACFAIIAASLDAIIIIDQAQHIIVFNPAAEQLYGYSSNDVIGQHINLLIPERFRIEHDTHIHRFAKSGQSIRTVGQFGRIYGLHQDGHEFPAEASITRLHQNGNQYFSVIMRNLAEEQQIQESIRLSEQRYHTLISNLQGVVYRCELKAPWRVTFISDGTKDLTGYPAAEFLEKDGIDWATLVHPDDLAMVDEIVKHAIASGKQYEVQYRILHKNGSIYWVQEKGIAIYEGEQPLYLDGFIHDITDHKRMVEHQLLIKNASIEHSINAIAIANLQGELTYVNTAFLNMWGYEQMERVLGRLATEFWTDPQQAAAVIHSLQTAGQWRGNLRGKKNDGSEFITELSASLILDSTGKPSNMFASFIDVTEQFLAQQQLEVSYQLLDAVFDNTHVLIAVLDPEMNFIRVNHTYAAADGKQPDYYIGKNHFQLYPSTNNEIIYHDALRTGTRVTVQARPFEYAHNPERGISHWDWTLTPIKDDSGKVTSLVLSLLDVTERINAIEDLNNSRQALHELNETLEEKIRLRTNELAAFNNFTETLIDTVGALIIVLDTHGRIVRFNKTCEQVTGYKTIEVLGHCFWEFQLIPEERESVQHVFQSLRSGHFPNSHENYWLTKSGKKRWIAWSNTAIVNHQDEVEYIIGTGLDVTEKRQAENSLRESEFQFRMLADNIEDVFWLTSPDRRTLYYISPAYEKIWGRACAELYHNPASFLDPVHEDDRDNLVADHLDQQQGIFKDQYEHEFRIYRKDGSLRWIKSRYSPVTDGDGEVIRIAGISEDITDFKLAQDHRLQQERQQRDVLVREVHHRIKNNLQGVLGLLRQQTREKPELQQPMDTTITQISTMALVHGLQGTSPGERIQLQLMCNAIANSISGMTGRRIILNENWLQLPPLHIRADEAVPLALILNELVFNAVKHADITSRAISLEISCSATKVLIRISNPCRHWDKCPVIMDGENLGTGLSLVRSLLPTEMTVDFGVHDGMVRTDISICSPIVEVGSTATNTDYGSKIPPN